MCISVFNYSLAACPEMHVTNVTNDLVNPSNYLFHGEYLIRGIFFSLGFCRSTWTARWCKKCAVLPEPRYCLVIYMSVLVREKKIPVAHMVMFSALCQNPANLQPSLCQIFAIFFAKMHLAFFPHMIECTIFIRTLTAIF
jgi:hypothetical protein